MRRKTSVLGATLALMACFSLYGCPEQGPAEEAGEKIDETFEEAGEAVD